MRTRREFLFGATTTLLLVPVACSSTNSYNPGSGGSCAGVDSTSTNVGNHTHTVCVLTTDLTNPSASGATYTTSSSGNPAHTHTVTLMQSDLQTINSGGPVTVTTSMNLSHDHQFTIMKA